MRSIETLPPNIRSAIADALSTRGRDMGFLVTNGTPEVAPIIGGRDAPEFKYPWYARMFYFWYEIPYYIFCGGSVYNERTIITAAHCVSDPEQVNGYYVIHTGQHDRVVEEELEQITLVDKNIVHQGYRSSGTYLLVDDIALMITDIPLDFTTIAVKPLPSLSTREKDEMALKSNSCVAIGYGRIIYRPDLKLFPDNLQELSPLRFGSNRDCHKALWTKSDLSVTPKMICSLNQYDTICRGDSGGPVGCYDNNGNFYQVGVASWIVSYCVGEGVYTRISKYRRWIKCFSYKV